MDYCTLSFPGSVCPRILSVTVGHIRLFNSFPGGLSRGFSHPAPPALSDSFAPLGMTTALRSARNDNDAPLGMTRLVIPRRPKSPLPFREDQKTVPVIPIRSMPTLSFRRGQSRPCHSEEVADRRRNLLSIPPAALQTNPLSPRVFGCKCGKSAL